MCVLEINCEGGKGQKKGASGRSAEPETVTVVDDGTCLEPHTWVSTYFHSAPFFFMFFFFLVNGGIDE